MELATALITGILSLAGSSGIVVWYNSWIKSRNTDVDNDIKTSRLFIERLDKVEADNERLREQQEEDREEFREHMNKQDAKISELSEKNVDLKATINRFEAAVHILIARMNTLLDELSEHKEVPEEKRKNYTNLPIFGDE